MISTHELNADWKGNLKEEEELQINRVLLKGGTHLKSDMEKAYIVAPTPYCLGKIGAKNE